MTDVSPTDRAAAANVDRHSVFWPTVTLVVALVGFKASYVGILSFWTWATPKDYFSWLYVRWLAAASYADVLFAVGAGLAVAVLLLVVRRQPRAAQIISVAFLVFGAVSVLYAVVSREVFGYYAAPLTYQLLSLGGEPAKMWSSLEQYVTVQSVLALLIIPAAYVLLALWIQRLEAKSRPSMRRFARVVLAVALIAWVAVARQFLAAQPQWFVAQDRHLTDSAHGALLQSMLAAFSGTRANFAATTIRAADVRELARVTSPPAMSRAFSPPRSTQRPRKVILIVLESVGTQYLSLYGNRLNTTPRLIAEQSNAVVFDRYYAPVAWTAYSLMALVLSQTPPMERYSATSFRTKNVEGESLASVLRRSGYRTAFMAAGDPDWASAGFLERNGFQEVVHGSELPGAKQISSWGTEDRFLFGGMLEWIDKHRTEPFFLMTWTDQTHDPYRVAPGQRLVDFTLSRQEKAGGMDRYLGLVRAADTQIGELLDWLRRRGLADSTLVIVTGDHGEAFGKLHGGSGHGLTVYEEEVHVPLVLWNPALFRGGSRSAAVGSHPDLAPTVLDVLGIPAPSGWDGRSLFDRSKPPRAYFFAAAWGEYLLGLRDENVKYIYDARQARQELFDLSADPDEQKNLAAVDTARARRLRERLAAWLRVERSRSDSRNR